MNIEHIQIVQDWFIGGVGALIFLMLTLLWGRMNKMNEKLDCMMPKEDCKERHQMVEAALTRVGEACSYRHDRLRRDYEADQDDTNKTCASIASDVVEIKQKLAYANGVAHVE